MKKLVLLLMALSLGLSSAWAESNSFTREDISAHDLLAKEFTTPSTGRVDYSIPPGSYRDSCSRCEYDTKVLQCYCLDVTSRTSFFPGDFAVHNCQHIVNKGGKIVCGD